MHCSNTFTAEQWALFPMKFIVTIALFCPLVCSTTLSCALKKNTKLFAVIKFWRFKNIGFKQDNLYFCLVRNFVSSQLNQLNAAELYIAQHAIEEALVQFIPTFQQSILLLLNCTIFVLL